MQSEKSDFVETGENDAGPFVVGVDAGGTTVRVALASVEGELFATAEAAADAEGSPEPIRVLLGSVLAATKRDAVVSVCVGTTKISRAGVQTAWEAMLAQEFPHAQRVSVVPDFEIAFYGALPDGVGVVVIAGTGSVAFGANTAGVSARVGGRGWEYGDEGSGAWMSTEIVKRTLRAGDGLQAPSPLTDAVCELLGTTDAALLGERARQWSAERGRGFLTPLTLERANAGDREAANLFVGAGGWLALLARVAANRLGWKDDAAEAVPVALLGGMAEAGEWVARPFATVLARNLPGARIVEPNGSPLAGAVRLAVRQAQTSPQEAD